MLKISKVFLLLICLTFLVRFIFLDRIPVGVSNDELDYILNAKAVFLTGSDISGTWNPLSFTTPTSSFPQAEIPPLLTFLPIGLLPLSLFFSKSVYALFNCGIVILLYLLAKKLFSEKVAIAVGLASSINPWLLFFGRTAYDTPLAIFFFLLAWYLLLVTKGWKILFSIIPFFVAFFSYIGTKLIFIPIVVTTIFCSWNSLNKRKYSLQYIILLLLGFCIVLFYIFTLVHSTVTRVNELAGPNILEIKNATNMQRREIVQNPLTPLFINKYVLFGKYAIEKYFNAFSPNFLFLHGDSKALFSVFNHGVFYYTDIIFLLIGLYGCFRKNRNVCVLLVVIAIISPLPSVLSTVGISYAIRSMLLCPVLLTFIGYGMVYLLENTSLLKKPVLISVILAVYALQFLNFAYIYFLQNPISNSESFNMSGRVLAKYLSLNQYASILVIAGNPETQFKQYLFYTNSYNMQNVKKIQAMYRTKQFKLNNVSFLTCSDVSEFSPEDTIIYESNTKCKFFPKPQNFLTIAQLSDGGSVYSIKNDSVCSKYQLNKYPQHLTFADLDVESLSKKQFCETFITNYFQ